MFFWNKFSRSFDSKSQYSLKFTIYNQKELGSFLNNAASVFRLLHDLLQTADLYCSPALYGESFGMVLLEAMAAGCVVVAGNNPGYASVLQERGRLSLVNPLSTIDFSQRLELLLYDQDVRDIWLSWANKYVIQFDYSHVVDAYEAAYRDAIKASTKKRKQAS